MKSRCRRWWFAGLLALAVCCARDLDEVHAEDIVVPDPDHRPDRAGRLQLTMFADPADPFAMEGSRLLATLREEFGDRVEFAESDDFSLKTLARMDALGLPGRGFVLQGPGGAPLWRCEDTIPQVDEVRRALAAALEQQSPER